MTDEEAPTLQAKLQAIAQTLDGFLNSGHSPEARPFGFTLVVWEFDGGENGRATYISNATRDEVHAVMRRQLKRDARVERGLSNGNGDAAHG